MRFWKKNAPEKVPESNSSTPEEEEKERAIIKGETPLEEMEEDSGLEGKGSEIEEEEIEEEPDDEESDLEKELEDLKQKIAKSKKKVIKKKTESKPKEESSKKTLTPAEILDIHSSYIEQLVENQKKIMYNLRLL